MLWIGAPSSHQHPSLRPESPASPAASPRTPSTSPEILGRINELFADEDFTRSGIESWTQGIVTVLIDDERISAQAAAITQKQFFESPDKSDAVTGAVISNQDTNNRLVDHLFARDDRRAEMIRLLGALAYEEFTELKDPEAG